MPSSMGSSQPRDRTCLLYCRQILYPPSHLGNPKKERLVCTVQVPKKNPVENLRELGASSGLFPVFAAGLAEARIK